MLAKNFVMVCLATLPRFTYLDSFQYSAWYIDTLRLEMCSIRMYKVFWTGSYMPLNLPQNIPFTLIYICRTHWNFYRKRDNTIPDFFLLLCTFFTYFVSPIFFFVFSVVVVVLQKYKIHFCLSKWHANCFYINHYIMKA